MSTKDNHRDAVRRSLEIASPGTLAWLESTRGKFQNSKLTGIAIQNEQGDWLAAGALHNPATEPDKQPDTDKKP